MYLGHNDLTIFKDILANRGLDYDRALFLMNNDQALNEVRAIKFLTIFLFQGYLSLTIVLKIRVQTGKKFLTLNVISLWMYS